LPCLPTQETRELLEWRTTLRRLEQACEALEDGPAIVRLATLALGASLPRCLIRGYASAAAGSCGLVAHAYDGELIEAAAGAPSPGVLPLVLSAATEGRVWRETVREGYLTPSELGPLFDPLAAARGLRPKEWGVYVAARGPSLAGAHVLLPERAPQFTEPERETLRVLLGRLSTPLRIAALIQDAAPGLAALDHLLAARPDRLLLVSQSGKILGGSPTGERLLARQPALAHAIHATFQTSSRHRPRMLALPGISATAFVSACSRRGSSNAYLVEISDETAASGARLSQRQAELLELVAEGLTNKTIGQRMGLSPATVKTMLERLYRRAGVPGRVALLRWARSS
jgi:DNA-binding NarL/FixJ family response regulator